MSDHILTPLQQLNLFIHMSLDYPDDSLFYPYLQRKGIKIKVIGQQVPVPSLVRTKFKEKYNTKINQIVEPEIIFENTTTGDIILLECKTSSFSNNLEDRGAKQALGYLSLENNTLRQYLGLSTESTKVNDLKVLYSTNNKYIEELDIVLDNLNQKLIGITGNLDYEVIGIETNSNGIYINLNENQGSKKIKISKIAPGNINGSVMYIIPLDPSINFKDEYGLKVIEEKIKTTLLISMGRMAGIKDYQFSVSDVCNRIIPVWDIWSPKAKKKVKRLVIRFLKRIIGEMKEKKLNVDFDGVYVKVYKCDQNTADKLRIYLKSIQFNDVFNETEQIEMGEFIDL
ncbi:hypothetical protein GJU41_21375 [Bacillus idriensis]|uniref:Uncharacterized protein n=1 Tax=Metabacillus idriensis TaxID=324768 RepID=A0A6I2MKX2_9BACI|nr:hypothetical protein [Metabacillus idriensis]MRX56503.1 hypothetical protein [Metabacillus idriensis]